jgi:lysozyme family protein
MPIFLLAFEYVMQYEDSRHTWAVAIDSNGGRVVAGINSKSFPADVAAIVAVAQAQREPLIQAFYRNKFWMPMLLGALNSQDLANRVMDAATNTGQGSAAKQFQQAINFTQMDATDALIVDGVVGPKTIAAANAQDQVALLNAFRKQRVTYYDQIVAEHPTDTPYLTTWLARAQA